MRMCGLLLYLLYLFFTFEFRIIIFVTLWLLIAPTLAMTTNTRLLKILDATAASVQMQVVSTIGVLVWPNSTSNNDCNYTSQLTNTSPHSNLAQP